MVTIADKPGLRIFTGLGILFLVLFLASFTCAMRPTQPLAVSYEAVTDGHGGAIIVWQSGKQVVAQRLSSTGHFLWPAPALLGDDIPPPPVPQKNTPQNRALGMAADGQGGAFIATYVSGGAPGTMTGVLQHVNANGDVSVWGTAQKPSAYRAGNVTPSVKATDKAVYLFDRGLIVKYSRVGQVLWRQQLAYGEAVLDSEGNIFTTWKVDDYLGNATVSVAAYSSSGNILWTREEKTESFNGGIPGHVPGASTGSARLAVTPKGLLVRIATTDWAIQNGEKQGPPIHMGWVPGGVLEDIVVEPGPSEEVLFTMYGLKNSPTRKVVGRKGEVVDVPSASYFGDSTSASAIILRGIQADGGTWEQTLVETAEGDRAEPRLASDESGYLIVWRQWRKDPTAGGAVWLQGINTGGSLRWREPVKAFPEGSLRHQSYPVILSDGSGGGIVLTNTGSRARQAPEIRAQHVSPSGQLLWGPQGILVTRP